MADKEEVKEVKETVKVDKTCFKKYPWTAVTRECRTCKHHVDCKKGSSRK